jgi:hypothetical protein
LQPGIGIKVAIRTFALAKGDMQIEAQRHHSL